MKNMICIGLLGVLSSVGTVEAACPYLLDATTSQINAGFPAPLFTKFPSVNTGTQRSLVTAHGTANSTPPSRAYIAASASGAQNYASFVADAVTLIADKSIPANGVLVLEYRFNNFPAQLTGTTVQEVNSGVFIYGGSDSASPKNNFSANIYLSNGTQAGNPASTQTILRVDISSVIAGVQQNTYLQYPVSQPVSSNLRVGAYFNQDTKQLGLNVNGIDKGYIAAIPANLSKLAFMPSVGLLNIPVDSPVIGQSVSATLVTDAAQMTLNYQSGAKDICSNPL